MVEKLRSIDYDCGLHPIFVLFILEYRFVCLCFDILDLVCLFLFSIVFVRSVWVGGGLYRRKRFLRDDKTPPHRPEPFWLPPSGSLTVSHARSRFPHRLARFFAARRAQVWAPHRHQHRLWDYLRARQVAHDVSAPGYHNICPASAWWR